MLRLSNYACLPGTAALLLTSAIPTLLVTPAPLRAQASSPMPAQCAAASQAVEAENARIQPPPSSASAIVQMQHALFLTGMVLDALDQNCRDWADYARAREQYQSTFDSTLQTCQQVTTDPSECRRMAYGGISVAPQNPPAYPNVAVQAAPTTPALSPAQLAQLTRENEIMAKQNEVAAGMMQRVQDLNAEYPKIEPCGWAPGGAAQDPCLQNNFRSGYAISQGMIDALDARRAELNPTFYAESKRSWEAARDSNIKACTDLAAVSPPCSLAGALPGPLGLRGAGSPSQTGALAPQTDERYWLKGVVISGRAECDPFCPDGPWVNVLVHTNDVIVTRQSGGYNPSEFGFGPHMKNGTQWRVELVEPPQPKLYHCEITRGTSGIVVGNEQAINIAGAIPVTEVTCKLTDDGRIEANRKRLEKKASDDLLSQQKL